MRIDTPEHMAALNQIVPIVAWSIGKMQSDISPDALRRLEGRSRASVIHDFTFDYAEEHIESLEGIKVGVKNGLRYFVLEDVYVRLHRVERGTFNVSVNRNHQTQDWNAPLIYQQLAYEGVPDPNVHFTLAYVPNEMWAKLDQVIVGLYRWETPVSYIDLDIDAWYSQVPVAPEPIRPIVDRPSLQLKASATQPLEGIDGNASGS